MEPRSRTSPRSSPPAPAEVVLAARGITKSYEIGERRLEILHGVDLELHAGELLALVGSSGAGKSTLLHCLGLLDRPDRGTVELLGVSGWDVPLVERARVRNAQVGFVFQFYHLLPELTALENVLLPAMIGESRLTFTGKKKEHRERGAALLERFGLAERMTHRPSQLSGGERQRVAMARALYLDPPLLLADEPTGNLDSATGAAVLELLLEEQRRRRLSMILVTHDEKIAQKCERVVSMKDGRIVGGG
ncbi:MAG: ABC transporter ATP-binding protein [Planctomycetes bacterium]|nr:ABC transporter ATP-binding protein [Planctomycetota bacterium]